MTIYVIKQFTEQNIIDYAQGYLSNGSSIGFYSYLDKAIDVVENNVFDLSDSGYYTYVVILEVEEGLYNTSQVEH